MMIPSATILPFTVATKAHVLACILGLVGVTVSLPTANRPQSYGAPPPPSYGSPQPAYYAEPSYYQTEAGAVVNIQPGNTDQGVVGGSLNITRHNSGILITGYMTGLTPGKHGFHIHTEGLLTNQCKDAAGHFNPFMKNHASPDDTHRHVGDLGNIVADDSGVAKLYILDSHASLNPKSEAFIGRRSIVIHAGEDDLGRGGDEGSLKTGNAGGRVGCGTIVVQENQPYRAPSHSHNQYQGYAYPSPLHGYPYHYPFGYHSYGSSIW